MYGDAKGLMAPRAAIWGRPPGKEALNEEDGPMFSGIHAPQNSLTMEGPTTEPMANDIDDKRLKLAMLMAGRGMTGLSQGMSMSAMPASTLQNSPFDLYGNPIGGR